MGIKLGEIDSIQILDNEFRIAVLERVVDLLLKKNPSLEAFSVADLNIIRDEVVLKLKEKYPNSGIEYKK